VPTVAESGYRVLDEAKALKNLSPSYHGAPVPLTWPTSSHYIIARIMLLLIISPRRRVNPIDSLLLRRRLLVSRYLHVKAPKLLSFETK
jgi:hypothetical protein